MLVDREAKDELPNQYSLKLLFKFSLGQNVPLHCHRFIFYITTQNFYYDFDKRHK